MKGPTFKSLCDGIYSNGRFIHAAASLVGCVIQVQVKNGALFEGVFRTFSQEFDLVLEMAHEVENKNNIRIDAVGNSMFDTITSSDAVIEKLIFKLQDVVMLTAINVDLDYAIRDTFTDTGISKFNGEVTEKELEPWDGPPGDADGLTVWDGNGENANGWDVTEMFRTNEEKYGVTSSYDSSLHDYTIPLQPKNTDEYKKQEAKACKIASEIENSCYYKSRIAMESTDEEEKYSAVIRPDENNTITSQSTATTNLGTHRYMPPPRRRNVHNPKTVRSSPSPAAYNSSIKPVLQYHQSFQNYHCGSNPASLTSQVSFKTANSVTNCASSSPRPTPSSTPTPKQCGTSQHPRPQAQCLDQISVQTSGPQERQEPKLNGDKGEQKPVTQPPRLNSQHNASGKETVHTSTTQSSTGNRTNDRRHKNLGIKGRDEKTEELKRFHNRFKLSEEKELKEQKDDPNKNETLIQSIPFTPKQNEKEKEKIKDVEKNKMENIESEKVDIPKVPVGLNPTSKEFVLNPNAKAFTPRSLPSVTPPGPSPLQPPPRLHTQSPVVAVSPPHLVHGMNQPIFATMTPQYVVPATPVSVPLTLPFTPGASVAQGPRFRKAVPISLPGRHDLGPSVQVAAATGQPILASGAVPTHQLPMQYTTPGMLHSPGPSQPTLAYAPMYPLVGPRMLTPQALGLVPSSATYGEGTHLPTHLYMSAHPGTTISGIPHAVPIGAAGPHSSPSTPQSQTPAMHAAPSPVHHSPHSGLATPGQPPTPTGHPATTPTPQPMVYHSHLAALPHSSNLPPPHSSAHTLSLQPVMLMPQQANPGPRSHPPPHIPSSGPHVMQGHPLHSQNSNSHAGNPSHILSHPPITVIPTSMVPAQTAPVSTHFVPHPQV